MSKKKKSDFLILNIFSAKEKAIIPVDIPKKRIKKPMLVLAISMFMIIAKKKTSKIGKNLRMVNIRE